MIRPSSKPLQIVLYQDVLCGWCYVADRRLELLRQEFGELVRWRTRPFPLRLKDAVPTEKELRALCRELDRAQAEPEGAPISSALWRSADPPRSSLPALVALEAARLQGREARDALWASLQRAALELSVNVSRSDVLLELAHASGLEMGRFVPAFQSDQVRRLVMNEHRLASGRGVRGVPALVIGERWMISGVREVHEYRRHILDCLSRQAFGDADPSGERLVH
jgi:predicted DsbA family dithiol-disulfide isomerase